MTVEKIEISVTLPRLLWEQVMQWAQTEHENEATLLTRAIEQFLQQESLTKRLERECEALVQMEFDDLGAEDEWLLVQNEALNMAEANFG